MPHSGIIRSFTQDISIAPIQVNYFSKTAALIGYTVSELTRRSAGACLRSKAVGVVFKPATFRTQGTELTTESSRPINVITAGIEILP